MTRFLRDRRKAFTKAIMNDDWGYVRRYCEKYGVPMPGDERVMKAGIYKAVHECTDIPDDVKNVAIEKCLKLGFIPFIMPDKGENSGTTDKDSHNK